MEDWIKDGNGRMKRVHKRYVDVVAHMRDDGFLEPLSIAWRDGRTFRVTQVIEVGEFRPGFEGFFTAKYRVSIANPTRQGPPETGGPCASHCHDPETKEGALGNRGRLTDRTYCTARRSR